MESTATKGAAKNNMQHRPQNYHKSEGPATQRWLQLLRKRKEILSVANKYVI